MTHKTTNLMKLSIDGMPVDVLEVSPARDGFHRLMVRAEGTFGGPSSQHDVPDLTGAFRTNGHLYEFDASRCHVEPGRYVVLCRTDRLLDGTPGRYELASQQGFTHEEDAKEYAKGISPSRMPLVVTVLP